VLQGVVKANLFEFDQNKWALASASGQCTLTQTKTVRVFTDAPLF
jgi:hypothetical protein